jgi:hypothetical protein
LFALRLPKVTSAPQPSLKRVSLGFPSRERRALDAGGRSDAFLLAYRDFEIYDRSFTELKKARQMHLKKSALAHMETGSSRHKSGDYAGAIRICAWRSGVIRVSLKPNSYYDRPAE